MPASDQAATLARLQEVIDIENIPECYGGKLKWAHGDMPNVDPAIRKYYDYEAKDWPIGPVKMEGDNLVAMGSNTDGSPRHEIVGKLRRDLQPRPASPVQDSVYSTAVQEKTALNLSPLNEALPAANGPRAETSAIPANATNPAFTNGAPAAAPTQTVTAQ